MEWLSVVLSSIAVAISVAAELRSRRSERGQDALQTRLAAIEEAKEQDRVADKKRAHLVARVERSEPFWALKLTNEGLAEARNVMIKLPAGEVFNEGALPDLPIPVIARGQTATVPFVLDTWYGDRSLVIELTWQDASGQQSVQTTL